jgi:chromate transporter
MYIKLFLTFAFIGAFTFGGGYSMLPLFRRELVEKKKWLSEEEMTDLFSISQCLPGIIAVNTAVFVGHKQKKTFGSIAAAIGVILPSVIIILIIAAFLTNFIDIPMVQRAFAGLRVCVSVMIINAVFKLKKHSVIDIPSVLIFSFVFVFSIYVLLPVAALVALAGVFGISITLLRKKYSKNGGAQ